MAKHTDFSLCSKLALFTVSYSPLLLIMVLKTIASNISYLHWGGFNGTAIKCFFIHFSWLSCLVILISTSIFGLFLTLSNLKKDSTNGYNYRIKNVEDMRPESINYLATYVFPFVFEENSITNVLSMFILFVVILLVTINTNLIILNPILSMFMGIYSVDIMINGKERHVFVISRDKNLEEKETCKLYKINKKIFIAKN